MPQDKPSPETTLENSLLQQAVDAIRSGDLAQARDLLTKLLQTDQSNPDYWVWMSAAMETQKERLYCLQTAFKLDPTNEATRRGLTLMGALTRDEPIQPFPMNHPRPWEARLRQEDAAQKPKVTASPAFRIGAAIGLLSLLVIGSIVGIGMLNQRPTVTPEPQGTARPTVTPYATNSNQAVVQVSTVRPLAELVSTPYTPTPIYAATPHGEAAGDSYKGALRAYKNGQWELMGSMMAQVATAQPGSADALYFIGESKRLSGNFQDAIDYYESAIDINPKFAPSYLGRARANLGLDPKRNIIPDLNKAIETDPMYAEAYVERGLYYLNRKDMKPAQADLEQAASLSNSPLVQINLARVLLAVGDTKAAVEAAKQANALDVTMLDGYLVLGMAYRANGQADLAVDVLETYLKYLPNNSEAFAVLGAAYFSRGEYLKAEDNLAQSVLLDKVNPDGYYWLAQTQFALKKYALALPNFLKARDLNPDSFDVGEGLAKTYMAQGEFNNSYIAIIKVEKSAVSPAQHARFIYIRALSLDQLNQPAAALRDWTDLSKMPEDATSEEMRQTAQKRIVELYTVTPTLKAPTPTRTITPTPAAINGLTSKTPKPIDTRVPTSTP